MPLPHIALLLCLCLASSPATARMYEWTNPASGRVQLSGEPPSWYRAPAPGPRVRVFENGTLVDDTAIALTAAENAALREHALAKAEERRQLDALRELELIAAREAALREAAALDAQRRAEAEQRREERAAALDGQAEEPAAELTTLAEELLPRALDADTIERFKDLIREFDRAAGAR